MKVPITAQVMLSVIVCWITRALSLTLNGKWNVTNSNNSIHIKGMVPGGIYTDLQHAGILGDPYYRFNDINYRWVAKESWNYTRSFSVSAQMMEAKAVTLICKGLDTMSTIYVNDNAVGKSSNMFVCYSFDVKRYLKIGENTITVAFTSPVLYAKEQAESFRTANHDVPPSCPPSIQNGECHANFIRKIQSEFSWDWGPAFPSVGIWKDIEIEARNGAAVRDLIVSTLKDVKGTWRLHLRIFSEVIGSSISYGELDVLLESAELATVPVKLAPDRHGISEINVTVEVPQTVGVELWWPNGAGRQPLYNLTVILTTKETSVKSVKVGFRTVELVQDPIAEVDGATFYFKINDIPIFMKGSNWITADSFPERVTPDYTRRLLLSAKEANMNLLRVWGGGMYETDVFYNVADELGIMIWQDFMFACALYPAEPTFLKNVKTEVMQQVKRLQHHPSILIWAGNNENEQALVQGWFPIFHNFRQYKSDYLKLYHGIIKPVVASLDPSRPYVLSSPSNGIKTEEEGGMSNSPQSNYFGDVHYYNYMSNSWDWTIYPTARFVSEYGFQSWTSFETLSKVSVPEDWNLQSKFFNHRQHHTSGNMELKYSIDQHFNFSYLCPENSNDNSNRGSCDQTTITKNFIYLTQITQAMGIKTESEHYLRSQSLQDNGQGLTMGALYWQLNDIWQCPSWASIEFGGKWKVLHYYAKNFFAPLLVSPYEDNKTLKVSIVSDMTVQHADLTLDVSVYQWKSLKPIYTTSISFTQKPTFANSIYAKDTDTLLAKSKCPGRSHCFIYFTLRMGNSSDIITSNFYFLTEFHTVEGLAQPNIEVTVENGTCSDHSPACTFKLVVTSENVAIFVWLETKDIDGYFSDNGFLIVNPTTELSFYSWEKVSVSDLRANLSVTSLVDAL